MSEEFFERPAPVPEPEPRAPSPPWTGPPDGMLPGVAALEVVLAGNDELDPSLNGVYHRPGRRSTFEEMLRFGIEFSDGRKVTNVGAPGLGPGEPTGPVLWGMGGGGGGGRPGPRTAARGDRGAASIQAGETRARFRVASDPR